MTEKQQKAKIKQLAQKQLDSIYKEFRNNATARNFAKLNTAMLNFQDLRNKDWKL